MMLAGAGHQHAIGIWMIVLFGIQGGAALLYLLYKKVGFRLSLSGGTAIGNVLVGGSSDADMRATMNKIAADLADMKDKTAADLADIRDGNVSLGNKINLIDEKTTAIGTNVNSIKTQLKAASHQAYFWNISSLVFGVIGVVLGIIAL